MNIKYVRELESFSKSEILEYLENDEENLKKLKVQNIIQKNKNDYKFHYVGVIAMDNLVLNVYPKYIRNENNIEEDFKEILKVINKYNKLHDDFDYQNDDLEDISIYILSLMLFFIEDYYENGVYHNIKNILETNGNGEINWDRTINNTFPVLIDNKPFYVELQTNNKVDNLFNYFRLLHEYIITESSNKLSDAGLIEILDLTPVYLSDKILEDFGNPDYILNRINMELNIEYNTHKRKLLKSMHAFLSLMDHLSNEKSLTVYGTTDYEYVWEEMCSKVFDSKLDQKLVDLNLNDETNKTLRTYINKPVWYIDGGKFPKKTLRPDLITIHDDIFMIFDAKYYYFTIDDGNLKHQPELESITKQYLYELVYKKLISDNFKVKNAFLFPKYNGNIAKKGKVVLDIWGDLDLQDIDVIRIPADKLNKYYLDNETLDIYEEIKKNELIYFNSYFEYLNQYKSLF